ncbi:hypothetical protein B7W85_10005 [Allorhizobium ampelinum]|nr:hypothetical protein B7W85_10005 [Allorhizobium ampelinum]
MGFGNRIATTEILDRDIESSIEDTLSILWLTGGGLFPDEVKNARVGELNDTHIRQYVCKKKDDQETMPEVGYPCYIAHYWCHAIQPPTRSSYLQSHQNNALGQRDNTKVRSGME